MLDALVVGGDSRIGGALYDDLTYVGYAAEKTTRRLNVDRTYLDLDDPGPLPPARVTYICAAKTGFKPCEDDPAGAWRVNVNGALTVARNQVAQGGRVVFLSSSAAVNHLSKDYGYFKLKAEQELFALGENAAVYRFGPVKSETRQTYPDGYYNPVDLDVLVETLTEAVEDWQPGLHLVGYGT